MAGNTRQALFVTGVQEREIIIIGTGAIAWYMTLKAGVKAWLRNGRVIIRQRQTEIRMTSAACYGNVVADGLRHWQVG